MSTCLDSFFNFKKKDKKYRRRFGHGICPLLKNIRCRSCSALPPEWIQIQVLRSPASPMNPMNPVKRLPMQQKQHPLHPVLPLAKEKDVSLIHHHQDQQPPTKIIVVSVWRICRWIAVHLHAWNAVGKQFIIIAKTIFWK